METFSMLVPPSMVDDEPALRSYVTRMAAGQGFTVDPAAPIRTSILTTRPQLVGTDLEAEPVGRAEVDVIRA